MKGKFSSAKKLSEVDVKAYDAVFYVGGHGPVLDLASDPVNAKLVSEVSSILQNAEFYSSHRQFWKAGKIVSAVCHGPA